MINLVLTVAFVAANVLQGESAPQYYQPQQYYHPYQPVYSRQYYPSSTPTPVYYPTAAPTYARSVESQAPILRNDQTINPDGSYSYSYQTGNGIAAEEQGGLKAIGNTAGSVASGSYSYTSPEGIPVSISYIADENGFRAVGDAIPTSPPVPAAIQRALNYIAARQGLTQRTYK